MGAVPNVKSFCGCCDLKVACIIIASFRMVASIINSVLVCISFLPTKYGHGYAKNYLAYYSAHFHVDSNRFPILAFTLWGLTAIQIFLIFINIFCSYNFILGAISNRPHKMKSYIIVEGISIGTFVLMIPYQLIYILLSVIECYILICSYSLYQECKSSSQIPDTGDATETTIIRFDNVPSPPPLYESCVDSSHPLNIGLYRNPTNPQCVVEENR